MIEKIKDEAQYKQVMALIEQFIMNATDNGGFNFLSEREQQELSKLSSLAEQYEDYVERIMPLPVTYA